MSTTGRADLTRVFVRDKRLVTVVGAAEAVMSRPLGHAKPQITATVYAHLLGDSQLDEAAAVFDAAPVVKPAPMTLRRLPFDPPRALTIDGREQFKLTTQIIGRVVGLLNFVRWPRWSHVLCF